MKWISVEDGLPEQEGSVWVIHEEYHPHKPIAAFYDIRYNCFTLGPHNYLLPSTICLSITHWCRVPPLYEETKEKK